MENREFVAFPIVKPFFSVLIPTYNREQRIRESVLMPAWNAKTPALVIGNDLKLKTEQAKNDSFIPAASFLSVSDRVDSLVIK